MPLGAMFMNDLRKTLLKGVNYVSALRRDRKARKLAEENVARRARTWDLLQRYYQRGRGDIV